MITLPQGDLPRDLGILSTVARYNHVHVGVYASVHNGRTIHRVDPIRLIVAGSMAEDAKSLEVLKYLCTCILH